MNVALAIEAPSGSLGACGLELRSCATPPAAGVCDTLRQPGRLEVASPAGTAGTSELDDVATLQACDVAVTGRLNGAIPSAVLAVATGKPLIFLCPSARRAGWNVPTPCDGTDKDGTSISVRGHKGSLSAQFDVHGTRAMLSSARRGFRRGVTMARLCRKGPPKGRSARSRRGSLGGHAGNRRASPSPSLRVQRR